MTTAAFSQAGGTWVGGTNAYHCTAGFSVTGGTHTPTSGSFAFDGATAASASVDAASVTFPTVTINRTSTGNFTFTIVAGTTIPLGANPSTIVQHDNASGLINNGTITCSGTSWTHTGTFTNSGTVTNASLTTFTCLKSTSASVNQRVTINAGSVFPGTLTTLTNEGSLYVLTTNTAAWAANVATTFNGSGNYNSGIDASGVTFGTITFNRTSTANYSFTIVAGTTVPLGANPSTTMNGDSLFGLYNLGTITLTGTTWTHTGTFRNPGTVSSASMTTMIVIKSSGATANQRAWFEAGSVMPATMTSFTNDGHLVLDANNVWPNGVSVTMNNIANLARTLQGGPSATGTGAIFGNFIDNFGAGTGALTLIGSNTFIDFRSNGGGVAHTILFSAGSTQTVTTFTVAGVSGKLVTLASTVGGTKWRLTQTPPYTKICVDFVSLQDSVVDGYIGTWGITGVQGLTGEAPTGAQPTGIQGLTGVKGLTGVQGVTGFSPTGASPTGRQGITGLQGILTGIQGVTGSQPTGIRGITGVKGLTGASPTKQGITGVKGLTGVQGITGEQPTGAQSPVTGAQGITGVQPGNIGLPGFKGLTGIQGITGAGINLQTIEWNSATGVAPVSGFDGYHIMPRFGTVKDVLMSMEGNGTAGTTIVDVFRGTGTVSTTPYSVTFGTIFTTAGNRPMIGATSTSTNQARDSVTPDITAFKKGDVFKCDVAQAPTAGALLKVQLVVEYTGS